MFVQCGVMGERVSLVLRIDVNGLYNERRERLKASFFIFS